MYIWFLWFVKRQEQAQVFFSRSDVELLTQFTPMSSKGEELDSLCL